MKILNWYLKIYAFVAENRLKKSDLDPRQIHTHLVVVLSTGLLMWAYAFLAYFTISSPVPGIVGMICATFHLLSPLLFRVTANAFIISNVTIGAGIVHQGTFSFYTGGFESSILIWFGILPTLAGIVAGRKAALFWGILSALWAGTYLALHLAGFQFPHLISPQGELLATSFIVFGWIFLSTSIIYVMLLLNESKEKLLSEQAQKIEDLFRVLFHDLAGPLSRLTIGLNISQREMDAENKKRGFDIATKAADAMLEITQNIRRMYAMSKGKVPSDLSYCPLNEAIEYIQKLYAADLEKKNISLDFDSQKYRGLNVWVEPISFKNQVLGNVFSNAIKFSPNSAKIIVRAYPMNQQFHVIEIVDQGIGMSSLLMESLFDINKKTSRPGTSGEPGTGFGMHIMKSFVEMYQGKINVESNEESAGQGTTIKLFLKAEWNQGGSPLPE